jgi:predicted nucleotidyltransferase
MVALGGTHRDSDGQSSSIDSEESRRFDSVLFAALDALDEGKVDYALIGGIAASGLGRPRPTQDIDIFLRPEDAEAALMMLEQKGFQTEKTFPTWLYKAFKDRILVDVVFRSIGGIYFDAELKARACKLRYHGRDVQVVSPEDFIILKCAVHSEEGPHHWHDALSVLSQSKLDWDYLLHRSRKAPRRLLALLIYAQSCDIWIPNQPISLLHQTIYADMPHPSGVKNSSSNIKTNARKASSNKRAGASAIAKGAVTMKADDTSQAYLVAKIRETLAESDDTGVLDIDVMVQNNQILLRGQCPSEDHYQSIMQTVRHLAPSFQVGDQIQVTNWRAPEDVEDLS